MYSIYHEKVCSVLTVIIINVHSFYSTKFIMFIILIIAVIIFRSERNVYNYVCTL